MLDVIHYFFEEDNMYNSEEHMKSKLKTREIVYESLYGVESFKYKYKEPAKSRGAGGTTSHTQDFDDLPLDEEEEINPFKPRDPGPVMPRIRPTEFDIDAPKPFGDILDAPLG